MAQENANVLQAGMHVEAVGPNSVREVVAATGIDLSSLSVVVTPNNTVLLRFLLNEPIADDVLLVSTASRPSDPLGPPLSVSWQRTAGDTTQRAFEVLVPAPATPLGFSIQFWRIPSIGPSVSF